MNAWMRPLAGLTPYIKKECDDGMKRCYDYSAILDKHLLAHTFLASERITFADLFLAASVYCASTVVLDDAWRKKFPNVHRHFLTIANQPLFKKVRVHSFFFLCERENVPRTCTCAPADYWGAQAD